MALTLGGGLLSWPGTAGSIRVPFEHGVTVPRWRVHFRNINPREGRPGEGRYTVGQVAIGTSNGQGGWIEAPAVVASMLAVDGGEIITPWQDTPLTAGTEYLLAYSWTSTHPTKRVVGGGWTATDPLAQDAELTPIQNHPLDAWIEAEVPAESNVLAVFGDSIASGVTTSAPVKDSWLSIYCRSIGALPIHYAASGDTMAGWADPNAYKWQRWQNLTRPDAVVHAMGMNDINNGMPIWELQRRHLKSTRLLHELISDNVRVATITPNPRAPLECQNTRREYNSWLTGRTPDVIRFHEALSRDDRRISPGFDGDGTHLNRTGYRRMASVVPVPFA